MCVCVECACVCFSVTVQGYVCRLGIQWNKGRAEAFVGGPAAGEAEGEALRVLHDVGKPCGRRRVFIMSLHKQPPSVKVISGFYCSIFRPP